MASPDVVASALLLPVPLLSLVLCCFCRRSAPAKLPVLLFLAIVAAVAGGTALSVACGDPLQVIARVFAALLHATLSGISICTIGPSSQRPAFPSPFLRFFLSLAALLVACELISSLIPAGPLLLPAALGLASRGILLTLAISTAILLCHRHAAFATHAQGEKGLPTDDAFGETLGRVSSPTQATWPFPGSIALQAKSQHPSSPADQSKPLDLALPSISVRTLNVNEDTCKVDRRNYILLPLVIMIAQLFASLSAGLNVAASILTDGGVGSIDHLLPHVVLASAACTLLWSVTVLAVIQLLPGNFRPCSSEKQVATGYAQRPFGGGWSGNLAPRTPKPSISRRESDSLLDFLSLRDPFASSPPPPPPLPPIGLGLDEVDVGWNGNKEISVQYRFPAPRSIVKGGQRKGKTDRKKRLLHQDSARTLLPVPETRGTEADVDKDKGFGDEVRLAQLLLQSLNERQDSESPNTPSPVPTVTPPQPAHVQQTSRWSTGTTIQSVISASVSNKSGASTYTTCASEKVPVSRISMNTIASVLGSRKSSEAKRKSAMTASSSKG